ncbi:Retrovirus-related Pol polyprotein from transposon 17.6 [Araneus ventricosus]|uniref:RNA-directed DNA polymerase n=1 Tax=Araneus ventricosus TaxID=182803 RepID=A0A4Y2GEI1_ARAVE|nr:Retrovirus-related Pol polyprotein from transposon 17.6 [Araneus ventricosus]
MSSKYPEAIPVADINSVSVINALLEVFSRMGFPREIQCDLGTSFTSHLTTEFFERFGIKVTHSSVHHPQSNPVERFHRTLKRLLKVLCLESGEDWEKNLPATLLALRTVTHESTGFSPAELVHGKNLRTPEVLLYEHWVNPQESESSVTEYVFELINRMRRCQDLAVERMTEAQVKRKVWYDKNAVRRKFQVGDQVLVLATSKQNKLAVQWTGPGVIESQLSDTNYIVKMTNKNDKTQIYHVNLLKPYHQRPESVNLLFSGKHEILESGPELEIPYPASDPNIYDFEEIVSDSALSERLCPTQIEELRKLLGAHQKVFSNEPGKTHLVEHDIELISDQPIRSKPYRTSQRQTEILKSEIKRMLDLKIIEIGQSDYTSPMILVETPGKDPRPCIDYRRLNSVIRTEYFPLPNIEERVERVAAAKFITVIDLAKGYWQIPLSKRAQRLAVFVTCFGTYIPLRMPFGLVNAPYFFSKLMARVLENCEDYAVPYFDDIAIYSDNWNDHLQHIGKVLGKMARAKLTIKLSKCRFAQNHTKYLGHVVGSGVRTPAEAKIKAVVDFPTPTTKTQIRAFLGLAGYYAHYVKKFSVIAAPLTNALKGKIKRETILWTEECNRAFEELKRKLTNQPVLYAPNYEQEFIIQTDASDLGMGVVMSQRDSKNEGHPILYLSKKFSDAERKYSTTERECACIIYAIKKLKYYLDGQKFTIETDHNPLVWLKTNAGTNPRLMRWSLSLQPFNYKVVHRAGKKNQNADCLSRIEL